MNTLTNWLTLPCPRIRRGRERTWMNVRMALAMMSPGRTCTRGCRTNRLPRQRCCTGLRGIGRAARLGPGRSSQPGKARTKPPRRHYNRRLRRPPALRRRRHNMIQLGTRCKQSDRQASMCRPRRQSWSMSPSAGRQSQPGTLCTQPGSQRSTSQLGTGNCPRRQYLGRKNPRGIACTQSSRLPRTRQAHRG